MFFTDDSLLFCRAKVEDIKTIQGILEVYEKVSSQQINIDKTTLSFGKSVCDTTKDFKKELLGVLEIKEYEKYLGLPEKIEFRANYKGGRKNSYLKLGKKCF